MTATFVLIAWSLTGIGCASIMTRSAAAPRGSWAPMAAILGPFWAAVAYEQRMADTAAPGAVFEIVQPVNDRSTLVLMGGVPRVHR